MMCWQCCDCCYYYTFAHVVSVGSADNVEIASEYEFRYTSHSSLLRGTINDTNGRDTLCLSPVLTRRLTHERQHSNRIKFYSDEPGNARARIYSKLLRWICRLQSCTRAQADISCEYLFPPVAQTHTQHKKTETMRARERERASERVNVYFIDVNESEKSHETAFGVERTRDTTEITHKFIYL